MVMQIKRPGILSPGRVPACHKISDVLSIGFVYARSYRINLIASVGICTLDRATGVCHRKCCIIDAVRVAAPVSLSPSLPGPGQAVEFMITIPL